MIQRMNSFSQNDIISIRDFSKDDLDQIYSKTDEIIKMNPEQRREIVGVFRRAHPSGADLQFYL